ANQMLTVNGLGTWSNDSYNESASYSCVGWNGESYVETTCNAHATGGIASNPQGGTLTQINSGVGWSDYDEVTGETSSGEYGLAFTYTPPTDFLGTVTFTYVLEDWSNYGSWTSSSSSTATVSINVINSAP